MPSIIEVRQTRAWKRFDMPAEYSANPANPVMLKTKGET
jgi:hypothetical protein